MVFIFEISEQVTSLISHRHSSDKPMCLIFASHLPHGPYIPTTWPDGYYNNIHLENEQLKTLMEVVDNAGFSNLMFVYTSDHGLRGKWTVPCIR